ncbi:MAG: hypothetical protein PHX65_08830, partial [Sulfurimonas sp.]|nr:hypothetical protein [Sulfurimonas sp.]
MTNNQKKSIINFGLNKLKSILDINSNNIVSSFFKRALFSVIFISIISTIFVINFQQYTFYTSLADEIRTNVDERLDKYSENLKFTDMKILKE